MRAVARHFRHREVGVGDRDVERDALDAQLAAPARIGAPGRVGEVADHVERQAQAVDLAPVVEHGGRGVLVLLLLDARQQVGLRIEPQADRITPLRRRFDHRVAAPPSSRGSTWA